MKELNKYYVTPQIEVYELENEGFIAGSTLGITTTPVTFGNGEGGTGWRRSKDGSSNEEEELKELH